ncbi:MAG: hypothetical protein QXU46_03555 [Candidatus Bathyarchaeia archaeon]
MPKRKTILDRNTSKSETLYYTEIATWLKNYVNAALRRLGDYLVDAEVCHPGHLSEGIAKLMVRNNIKAAELKRKIAFTRELKTDIILLIYDVTSQKGEIVVCEVKKKKGLSLMDCSQLLGYCISADVNFGLLINVDGGLTDTFREILTQNTTLTHVIQTVNDEKKIRKIAFLTWESKTRRAIFLPNGYFKNLREFSQEISNCLKQS